MLGRLNHRGPDGEGISSGDTWTLGHKRLAILDLVTGQQPMTNEEGDLAVSFNGEIYNHRELRSSIDGHHTFKTRSDTEVLLHLYEEMGEDMLPKLDGMFAFAIAGPRGVLLARDPMGIKPLYYGRCGNVFAAASEIKAFPPMDELYQFPAGHAMIVDGTSWQFAPIFPPQPFIMEPSTQELLAETRRLLEEAVLKRLMSDVPVGVYLSGGLDSSLVAALMRPHTVELHSFTAGMADAPDLAAARQVAEYLGTEHHELIYNEEDVEKAIPDVIRYLESFDAPLIRSAIPMYFLSRLASRYVKVILTGEGADELFAGYEYLGRFHDEESLRGEINKIIVRLADTNLQRADRMTMAHGIEGRVPFLDMKFVRFVSRLPLNLIQPRHDRPEKWFLREACKGLLPPEILSRKKMKFSEGAGSSEVMVKKVEERISVADFDHKRAESPGLRTRSREELYYYQIWRDVMGPLIPATIVGRTCDVTAAAERP